MLIVIAYPIYYTIDLSFFSTPPDLALTHKIFVGFDNYTRILTSDVFWQRHLEHGDLDVASRPSSPSCSGFGAALALHREFVGRGLLRGILLIP